MYTKTEKSTKNIYKIKNLETFLKNLSFPALCVMRSRNNETSLITFDDEIYRSNIDVLIKPMHSVVDDDDADPAPQRVSN